MDFGLNDDQRMLAKYARDFLDNECPPAFVRSMLDHDTAYDPSFYKRMADLGWMGIAIPESYGGQGMTYVDLAALLEEMGRALVPGPYFASVCLAAPLILEAGSDGQKSALLPSIASGERRATVAHREGDLEAKQDGDGFVLSGTTRFVLDAHVADAIIVVGRTANGNTLFVVDAGSVVTEQHKVMDMSRRLCVVTLDGVRVGADDVLGPLDGAGPLLERSLRRSAALLSAECVGGAQKVLDMSVGYAREREQFGRPIGSFQAVKHKCADMLVDVELGRSAMFYAAWAASADDSELPLAASIAKAFCGEAYPRVATNGIHVHGGIGFTWEHDMHLYLKRAKANEMLLGSPSYHRDRVVALV